MASYNSGFLKESEYLQYAPQERGKQVHVNHAGCTAGTDTKERLYVKRNSDGSVVAYCHHCGKRGVSGKRSPVVGYRSYRSDPLGRGSFQDQRKERERYVAGDAGISDGRPLALPADATCDEAHWPARARHFITGVGVDAQEVARKGWAYSPRYDRVIIPVFDTVAGGLLGYQARRLDDDKAQPKYITVRDKSKGVSRLYYSVCNLGTKTCVLVEDALSAEKVGKFSDCIALLTTTGDDALKDKLLGKYDHVIIWLDDDNTDVKRKQLDLVRMLDPYVKVSVVRTSKDPKRHSKEEISNVLSTV